MRQICRKFLNFLAVQVNIWARETPPWNAVWTRVSVKKENRSCHLELVNFIKGYFNCFLDRHDLNVAREFSLNAVIQP